MSLGQPKVGLQYAAIATTVLIVLCIWEVLYCEVFGNGPYCLLLLSVPMLKDIFDLILRELRLGTLSLEHITSVSVGESRTLGKEAFEPCLESSNSNKSGAQIGIPGMQESSRHGHYRPVKGKGLNGPAKCDNEQTCTTAETLGLQALEIGEVEPCMFRLLALLCSVREYAVTRSQLAHPSSLRSIFSLLRVGSPRIQR